MADQGVKNTDIEIWREVPSDYHSPAIHVTEHGDIGIKVGGHVLVASAERWFTAGEAAFCVEKQPDGRWPPSRSGDSGAKPGLSLKQPHRELEGQMIETMLAALGGDFPKSVSDLQCCIRGLIQMFEIKRRPLAFEIPLEE